MNLYVVRHGEAARAGGTITRDVDRPLTPLGEEDAVLVGRSLARIDADISLMLTSPLRRAVETGRIITTAFPSPPQSLITHNLSPGFRPRSLYDELLQHGSAHSILLVGHQPDLTGFISFLVGDAGHIAIAMPAGSAAHVTLPAGGAPGEATLNWLLTPAILRRMP